MTDASHIRLPQKIRYRIVFNRSGRLNKRGEGLVQIECQQGRRRCYFSTGIHIEPRYWRDGQVIDHELARDLNVLLRRRRIDIERVELGFMLRDVPVTLHTLREAISEQTTPTAQLTDFGRTIIEQSDRRDVTKANYRTMLNDIDRFRRGVRVDEVDYPFVVKYDQWLKDAQVAHNTRVGRLRLLRAVLNEAVKRDMIARNPFDRYRVEGMTSRHGFLGDGDIGRLERLNGLSEREATVRDAFLFCCYTGLRWSDFKALQPEHIKRGWIRLTMQKTGQPVAIPYTRLFEGRAQQMLDRYGGDIHRMNSHMPTNSQVNSTLRDLLRKACLNLDFRVTFHTSRHTFASLLLEEGMPVTTVQRMLGHTKVQTTQIYAEVTERTIEKDVRRLAGKPQRRKRPKNNNNSVRRDLVVPTKV